MQARGVSPGVRYNSRSTGFQNRLIVCQAVRGRLRVRNEVILLKCAGRFVLRVNDNQYKFSYNFVLHLKCNQLGPLKLD